MELKTTSHDYEWHPKYFAVIAGLFCGLYAITAAINSKLFVFEGFILPAGIIVFPICCIITDILTEIYGFNRARKAIWTGLACILLYAAFTQLAILLPPADFWPHQEGFAAIFDTSWRLALAGCCAWVAGEFSNSYILSRMKIFQNAKHMPVRFVGSTIVGQFFDTIVFGLVAFAGTMPWGAFVTLVLSAWAFKVGYEILALPLSIPITNWVKRLEGVEHFDNQKIKFV